MATGIACRLHGANLRRIIMLETPGPLAVRRLVSFCEAVHDKRMTVEGIEAVRVDKDTGALSAWDQGKIAVLIDPMGEAVARMKPDVFIDATMAKRNPGTTMEDAPLVIALGPGFTAGKDCHAVIETNRGHNLGRILYTGAAEKNTGIPGSISGYTTERVLRSPEVGIFVTNRQIGDMIHRGDIIGTVDSATITAEIDGILRGLIRPGSLVTQGLKVGDIDPRGMPGYCITISEKARSLGGAVLEAILAAFNR